MTSLVGFLASLVKILFIPLIFRAAAIPARQGNPDSDKQCLEVLQAGKALKESL